MNSSQITRESQSWLERGVRTGSSDGSRPRLQRGPLRSQTGMQPRPPLSELRRALWMHPARPVTGACWRAASQAAQPARGTLCSSGSARPSQPSPLTSSTTSGLHRGGCRFSQHRCSACLQPAPSAPQLSAAQLQASYDVHFAFRCGLHAAGRGRTTLDAEWLHKTSPVLATWPGTR